MSHLLLPETLVQGIENYFRDKMAVSDEHSALYPQEPDCIECSYCGRWVEWHHSEGVEPPLINHQSFCTGKHILDAIQKAREERAPVDRTSEILGL